MKMTERMMRGKSKNSNSIKIESGGLLASVRDVLAGVLRLFVAAGRAAWLSRAMADLLLERVLRPCSWACFLFSAQNERTTTLCQRGFMLLLCSKQASQPN